MLTFDEAVGKLPGGKAWKRNKTFTGKKRFVDYALWSFKFNKKIID